jgi:hypothetical protein
MCYKWFTAVHTEEKPMTGAVIIEKARSFCDEMEVVDKCAFSEGWL